MGDGKQGLGVSPPTENIVDAGEDRVWLRVESCFITKDYVYPGRVPSFKTLQSAN